MKTIKDIITRKQNYTSFNGTGKPMGKNLVSTRNILYTHYDKDTGVCIEKYQIEKCSYSKIRRYRRMEGGYRPELHTYYTYTYPEGNERLKSKDFKSLSDLIADMKKKTLKVDLGATTMKVLQFE